MTSLYLESRPSNQEIRQVVPFARLETQTQVRLSVWPNTDPTHQRQGEPHQISPPPRLRASGHPVMVNKGVSCSLCCSFFRSLGMSELTQAQ